MGAKPWLLVPSRLLQGNSLPLTASCHFLQAWHCQSGHCIPKAWLCLALGFHRLSPWHREKVDLLGGRLLRDFRRRSRSLSYPVDPRTMAMACVVHAGQIRLRRAVPMGRIATIAITRMMT